MTFLISIDPNGNEQKQCSSDADNSYGLYQTTWASFRESIVYYKVAGLLAYSSGNLPISEMIQWYIAGNVWVLQLRVSPWFSHGSLLIHFLIEMKPICVQRTVTNVQLSCKNPIMFIYLKKQGILIIFYHFCFCVDE